uniref:Uncharacterized protein n=1 Tax=Anguilla anguilla TaxID=7936 RepID=A0A0E9QHQ3_ANGAN
MFWSVNFQNIMVCCAREKNKNTYVQLASEGSNC